MQDANESVSVIGPCIDLSKAPRECILLAQCALAMCWPGRHSAAGSAACGPRCWSMAWALPVPATAHPPQPFPARNPQPPLQQRSKAVPLHAHPRSGRREAPPPQTGPRRRRCSASWRRWGSPPQTCPAGAGRPSRASRWLWRSCSRRTRLRAPPPASCSSAWRCAHSLAALSLLCNPSWYPLRSPHPPTPPVLISLNDWPLLLPLDIPNFSSQCSLQGLPLPACIEQSPGLAFACLHQAANAHQSLVP